MRTPPTDPRLRAKLSKWKFRYEQSRPTKNDTAEISRVDHSKRTKRRIVIKKRKKSMRTASEDSNDKIARVVITN